MSSTCSPTYIGAGVKLSLNLFLCHIHDNPSSQSNLDKCLPNTTHQHTCTGPLGFPAHSSNKAQNGLPLQESASSYFVDQGKELVHVAVTQALYCHDENSSLRRKPSRYDQRDLLAADVEERDIVPMIDLFSPTEMDCLQEGFEDREEAVCIETNLIVGDF